MYSGFLVSEKGNTDVENLTGKLSLFLGYDVEQGTQPEIQLQHDEAANKTTGLRFFYPSMNNSQEHQDHQNMYSVPLKSRTREPIFYTI